VAHPDGGAPPCEECGAAITGGALECPKCGYIQQGGAPPEPMDAMVVAFQREASAHGLDCPDHVVRPALLCALLVRAASRPGPHE
jgi:hypothetical protein